MLVIEQARIILNNWEQRLNSQKGKRGNGAARERLKAAQKKYYFYSIYSPQRSGVKEIRQKALGLAKQARIYFDAHGYSRNDYEKTEALDFVPKDKAKEAPYFDMGNAGLGVVAVTRTRYYAKSYGHGPSSSTSYYLVGRNEAGTFFAHAIPMGINKVLGALQWIWKGRANVIITRQGDVALIRGLGAKIPNRLPSGHIINKEKNMLEHKTHPAIRLPGIGERLIVARRAFDKRLHQTRD